MLVLNLSETLFLDPVDKIANNMMILMGTTTTSDDGNDSILVLFLNFEPKNPNKPVTRWFADFFHLE